MTKDSGKLEILRGDEARDALKGILDSNDWSKALLVAGVCKENKKFVAFDNRTGNCWTESFLTKQEAENWIND